MTGQKKTRRQKLEEFLVQNPTDAFTLYGLALECLNSADFASAESYFRTLIRSHPDYVPGYQMYAQTLAQNNRPDEARSILTQGIQAATRSNNQHARSEMESLLESLA